VHDKKGNVEDLLKGKSNKRGLDMAGAEPSCWTP